MHRISKQSGFTLIELMIALLIGTITIAAAIALYLTIFTGSMTTIRSQRLNYDLDSAANLIANELRRSGYNANAVSGYDDATTNPFATITISTDCVLYSYDWRDAADTTSESGDGTQQSEELFGFLRSNDRIYMRTGGTPHTCSLTDGNWGELSITSGTEEIEVQSFTVTASNRCVNISQSINTEYVCGTSTPSTNEIEVVRRILDISLTGRVGRDNQITKTSSVGIVVANDAVLEY